MSAIPHQTSRVSCLVILTCFVSVCPSSGFLASTCGSICDYDEGTKKADCSNRSLNLIPQQCSLAVSLNLQGNEISLLTSGMFSNFSDLKTLDISMSHVRESQSGSFSGVTSLKRLYLNGNNLTEIVSGMFDGINDLRILKLGNNQITSIGEGKFQDSVSLSKLFLADNFIRILEADSLLGMKSLITLSLSRNVITEIHEDTFGNTPNLENLYLGMNNITTLPKNIFQNLQSLKILSLAANQISTMPPSILRLQSLRRLDLQSNFLQDVSPLVPLLDQFTDLYLEGNPLLCSGCPQPLLAWVSTKYDDNNMECIMPDGTIIQVSSLVLSYPELVSFPVVSTPRRPQKVVTSKPGGSDDERVHDLESDLITTILFIVVPVLFIILISSIIFLEYQTRQNIARKENPRIFPSNGASKYQRQEFQDSDDEEKQGHSTYSTSRAAPSVSPISVQNRTESAC